VFPLGKLDAVAGLGAAPENLAFFCVLKYWKFIQIESDIILDLLDFLIYLADSGKFQIHLINSLVSLHWAEICRLV
jgi:hypothetical protein